MRLAIIGGGAMGTLFAGWLGPHAEVWVLSTHLDTVEALRQSGARIETEDGLVTARVHASLEPEEVPPADVGLICVKAYETERAGRTAARVLAPGGIAISLQNGLGNRESLARALEPHRVVQGVTYLGANWLGPGEVREAGRGPTVLEAGSSPDRVREVARLFASAGLESRVMEDSEGLIWGKLLVNSAINPLTALLRVPNGALIDPGPALRLLHRAVDEAAQIAGAAGVRLPYDDPRAEVENVCRRTSANLSSMLQDVLRKRPTEVEAINGALVREAERRGLEAPLHVTLRGLVQALEAGYAEQVATPGITSRQSCGGGAQETESPVRRGGARETEPPVLRSVSMRVVESVAALRSARGDLADPVGFVPTMGYLHEGHLSLVRRSRVECQSSVVSIFVNPTQFGSEEDLKRYPRDLERDLSHLEAEGVDLVFAPPLQEIYPQAFQTYVHTEILSQRLEGRSRPGHFRGVTTVVTKLFNSVQPQRAYFGQKDAQQALVVRRMVLDLNLPVEIVICPTVREQDGLALSSRNGYLDPDQRSAATALSRALFAARAAYELGETDAERLRQKMREVVGAEPAAALEYVSCADLQTLEELDQVEGGALLSLAATVGRTRLIDNVLLEVESL